MHRVISPCIYMLRKQPGHRGIRARGPKHRTSTFTENTSLQRAAPTAAAATAAPERGSSPGPKSTGKAPKHRCDNPANNSAGWGPTRGRQADSFYVLAQSRASLLLLCRVMQGDDAVPDGLLEDLVAILVLERSVVADQLRIQERNKVQSSARYFNINMRVAGQTVAHAQ